jgi:hypothetical protein
MPKPVRGALFLAVAMILVLGVLGAGIGTAGQHYTVAVRNAAKAVGNLAGSGGGGGGGSSVGAAALPLTATVSFESTIGSRVADPDTEVISAKWKSCIVLRRGSTVVERGCSTLPQASVVDPTLTVALLNVFTNTNKGSCLANVLLVANKLGAGNVIPIFDFDPDLVQLETGLLLVGSKRATVRYGTVNCTSGNSGDIEDGKGTMSRDIIVYNRTAVNEPSPTPTDTGGTE